MLSLSLSHHVFILSRKFPKFSKERAVVGTPSPSSSSSSSTARGGEASISAVDVPMPTRSPLHFFTLPSLTFYLMGQWTPCPALPSMLWLFRVRWSMQSCHFARSLFPVLPMPKRPMWQLHLAAAAAAVAQFLVIVVDVLSGATTNMRARSLPPSFPRSPSLQRRSAFPPRSLPASLPPSWFSLV